MRKRMREKTFYLSEKEYKKLKSRSEKLKMNQSEFIRELINNYTPIKIDIEILTNQSDWMKSIGIGLYNLTKEMYRYNYINELKYKHIVSDLNLLMKDITEQLFIEDFI